MLYTKKPERPTPEQAYLERMRENAMASSGEEQALLEHHKVSVALIKNSANRGMSRQSMEKIWGARLVNAVLGHAKA